MEHNINIRVASLSDLQELLRLNKNLYGRDQIEAFVSWKLKNNEELIAVAELENHLIGFACASILMSFCHDELSAEITEVYVEPYYREKGIGTAMVHVIETYLNKNDVFNIKISCLSSNGGMISLAKKLGYSFNEKIIYEKNK